MTCYHHSLLLSSSPYQKWNDQSLNCAVHYFVNKCMYIFTLASIAVLSSFFLIWYFSPFSISVRTIIGKSLIWHTRVLSVSENNTKYFYGIRCAVLVLCLEQIGWMNRCLMWILLVGRERKLKTVLTVLFATFSSFVMNYSTQMALSDTHCSTIMTNSSVLMTSGGHGSSQKVRSKRIDLFYFHFFHSVMICVVLISQSS